MRDLSKHRRSIVVFFVVADGNGFRGGKLGRRDSWYGLEDKEDFPAFRHWWHRVGKDEAGGRDLKSGRDAERAYQDWVKQGRPKVK